jgi:hypothetical protein
MSEAAPIDTPTVESKAGPIDITFTVPIQGNMGPRAWTVVVMPHSGEIFGTRKPVRVAGTMDGHPFEATLLPLGDGEHLVPIKAALRKLLKKGDGDQVAVHLLERRS